MDKKTQLYMLLANYGTQIPLTLSLNDPKSIPAWTEERFKYVQYNTSRPDIRREGLSITSLDGGVTGRPDLDTLYHADGKGRYDEMDFKVRTPVAEHPEIKKLLDHFGDNVGRSHILKINPMVTFLRIEILENNFSILLELLCLYLIQIILVLHLCLKINFYVGKQADHTF